MEGYLPVEFRQAGSWERLKGNVCSICSRSSSFEIHTVEYILCCTLHQQPQNWPPCKCRVEFSLLPLTLSITSLLRPHQSSDILAEIWTLPWEIGRASCSYAQPHDPVASTRTNQLATASKLAETWANRMVFGVSFCALLPIENLATTWWLSL